MRKNDEFEGPRQTAKRAKEALQRRLRDLKQQGVVGKFIINDIEDIES